MWATERHRGWQTYPVPVKSTRPRDFAARTVALTLAVAALVGGPAAGAAVASEGSVPPVVAAYAADPEGLLARLDNLFGVGAGGEGLDFGTDSKVGEVDRVWVWREAFVAGSKRSKPTKLVNEWTAAITIADKPVGVAIIWINTETDEPDLADFVRGASLGAALTGIPADAALVHDTVHSAWFALEGDVLIPLVAGTSGVGEPTMLAEYQGRLVSEGSGAPAIPQPSSLGAINSIVVVGLAILAVAGILILTGRRQRRAADAAAAAPAVVGTATKSVPAPAKSAGSAKQPPAPNAKPKPTGSTAKVPNAKPKPAASPVKPPRPPEHPA